MTFSKIIALADAWAPLLVLTMVVLLNNRKVYRELSFLLLYLFAQFFFNSWANMYLYVKNHHLNNYFVFHIALPCTFLALVFFFKKKSDWFFYTKAWFITGLTLGAYFILNPMFIQTLEEFNNVPLAIACAYILAVCINYLQRIVHVDIEFDILKSPAFWIIAGLFIYYSTSLVVFFSYTIFIKKLNAMGGTVWSVQNIMMMVGFALITKGILCLHYQTKRSPSSLPS